MISFLQQRDFVAKKDVLLHSNLHTAGNGKTQGYNI